MKNFSKTIFRKWKNLNDRLDYPNLILGAIIGVLIGWVFQPVMVLVNKKLNSQNAEFVNYTGKRIELLDKYGNALFHFDLESNLSYCYLQDVLGDDKKEIIIGTGDGGEKPGFVQIYSQKLKLLWEYDTYDTTVMNKLDDLNAGHSDNFHISHLAIADIYNEDKNYIIACAQDPTWFTTHIVILDPINQTLIGEFWHPGLLSQMEVADLDNDKIAEIIFCGVNNQLRNLFNSNKNVPVVFVMSPKDLSGQAFPGAYADLPIKSTIWYQVILPIEVGLRIRIEDSNNNGLKNIRVVTDEGLFYYFNFKGELVGIASSDGRNQRNPQSGSPIPLLISETDKGWRIDRTRINITNNTPDVGGLHLDKAIRYYQRGLYDSAILELRLTADLNPRLKRTTNLWQIRAEKKGQFGYIGIALDDSYNLTVVENIIDDSPAFFNGIKEGDVIISLDNFKLEDRLEFQMKIADKNPGDTVLLHIERDGEILTKYVILEDSN